MENHPIPQDVTGFQFKLIGNMTIKQFAYLATGIVMAWIFFASPLPAIIKIPFAFLFGLSGFCLAFLPLDGRPMDSMLLYFFKALFSPNQYIYQRAQPSAVHFVDTPIIVPEPIQQNPKKDVILASDAGARPALPGSSRLELTDSGVALSLSNALPRMTEEEVAPILQPKPEPEPEPIQTEVPKSAPFKEIAALPSVARNDEYEALMSQLGQTQEENLRLARELQDLKQTLMQAQALPQPAPAQPELASVAAIATTTEIPQTQQEPQPVAQAANLPIVKKVSPSATPRPGVVIPTDPNVLVGIIKDARGNVLPNILVEVKDKDGNPVRAFKTNTLGQFASATSLVSGVYTLEFDDPEGKQKFDALEITLQGEIIGPIEAISVDQREELRRALFQTN